MAAQEMGKCLSLSQKPFSLNLQLVKDHYCEFFSDLWSGILAKITLQRWLVPVFRYSKGFLTDWICYGNKDSSFILRKDILNICSSIWSQSGRSEK